MEVFNCEKDLVNAFSFKSQSFLRRALNKSVSRHFVIEEFDSYFGIADIVLGTYKPYLSRRNSRRPISLNWVNLLSSLKKGDEFHFEDFQCAHNLSHRNAILRLNEYIEAGFLRPKGNKNFEVINEYKLITDNVIAIEAKLKDWKRAIFQARRYKKFSDFSYVLLDEHYARPALNNIEVFEAYNIGLITMSNNNYSIHYQPTLQESKKEDFALRVNEAVYQYFSTYST